MVKSLLFLVTMVCMLSVQAASAKTIAMDKGRITFDVPDSFNGYSQAVLDIKYPSKNAPKYVVGNKAASTTIAYDIKPNRVRNLNATHKSMLEMLPNLVPKFSLIREQIVKLNGKEWGYLEFTSSAVDTDIHNIMLYSDYGNRMLIFNYNSISSEFHQYQSALRESMLSIRVK